MGGRLDATGVAPAAVSVITTIGLEHTQFLGATHEAIAAEKAGIMRSGQTVVSGVDHPGAARVIRDKAASLGATIVELCRDALIEEEGTITFSVVTPRSRYAGLQPSLAGGYQKDNAAMAVLAAEALDAAGVLPGRITPEAIVSGIAEARWPGRLQIVGRDPLFLLDGAHNPAGCAALVRYTDDLRENGTFDRLCVVFGALKEKDVASMAREIFPRAQRIVLTRGRSERFREPQDVARETEGAIAMAARAGTPRPAIVEDLAAAIAEARSWSGPRDAILLCGSLYLVGDALELMKIDPFPRALGVVELENPRDSWSSVSPER